MTQVLPDGQGGLVPQVHCPPLQLLDLESHAVHAFPPDPHAPTVLPALQALDAQQPVHESTVHMHCPLTQPRPEPQAGLLPHMQVPFAQWSARWPSQPLHAVPPELHWDSDGVAHVFPVQQLFGHDWALQTQAPPEHR
jgi:hypothetical protein